MATSSDRRRARLSIDVEPELQRRIKVAAAARDISVRDYVADILERALAEEERSDPTTAATAWTGLSAPAFARD